MSTITSSAFEPLLIPYFLGLKNSQNYELWYRIRVLKYANLLHLQYGGDIDVICALVFLRQMDVKYFEFVTEDFEDIAQIKLILEEIKFPKDKTKVVLNYIQNRAQSILGSAEEKIINDAFVLGGLGAAGLVRLFMWNEFAQFETDELLRIDDLFKGRLEKLTTPQGINLAEKENKFVYLFSALLKQEPRIEESYPGKYIILEGNSGTGKDSQAEFIKEHYVSMGIEVAIVKEPSQVYRDFESFIESATEIDLNDSAPMFRLYSIIGDRYSQIQEKVIQELKQGKIVISVRSYISMLVYQCENEFERLFVNFVHSFVPRPDIIILYDADEEICLQRVLARGTKMTPFDKMESLKKYRPLYLDIVSSRYFDFPIKVIDASGTIEQVAEDTIVEISKYI